MLKILYKCYNKNVDPYVRSPRDFIASFLEGAVCQ